MKFNENLRELRKEKGLTLSGLACAIGSTASGVSMYERGEREPNIAKLIAMADFFGVSLDYLLGRSEIRNVYALVDGSESIDLEKLKDELAKSMKAIGLVAREYGESTAVALQLYLELTPELRAEVRGMMKALNRKL